MQKHQTSEMEILTFHPKHLEVAEIREHEMGVLKGITDSYKRLELLQKQSNESFTLFKDGRIIGCCGFIMTMPGVAEIWMIPTVYVKTAKVSFIKSVRLLIEVLAKGYKVHRAQTHCSIDDLHDRWMKSLGFQCEGVLRKFTHLKEDQKLWSRIFENKR